MSPALPLAPDFPIRTWKLPETGLMGGQQFFLR